MTDKKARTVDGETTPISTLNTGVPQRLNSLHSSAQQKWVVLYRRVSEVLAGMYTGVGCAGTPRSYHSYKSAPERHNPSDKTSN